MMNTSMYECRDWAGTASAGSLGPAWGAELKVIQTQKTKDMVVTLLSESGQWTQGKNSFVLAFTSAETPRAGGCRQGDSQHQHADARHVADDRRGDAYP